MRFSNLHTHSVFSDGKNTPEEIVLSAIEKNFVSIGFSDHSHTPCDESYCMLTPAYPEYFKTVLDLKKKYEAEIDVLLGMELDYYSELVREPLDYVIASVHYIVDHNGYCHPIDHSLEQQQDCIAMICDGDRVEMAKRYYELMVKNVERVKPDVVGHFDVITKFGLFDGDLPEYRRVAIEALDEVMKVCPRIEMNTGAISRKKRDLPYPADFLLHRILENGGEVILSADSHAKETLDCFFPESVDILRQVGFKTLSYLDKNGFHKMDI